MDETWSAQANATLQRLAADSDLKITSSPPENHEEIAKLTRAHMAKLVLTIRNDKVMKLLTKVLDIKEDQGDLQFESWDSVIDSKLANDEKYHGLIRSKEQTERDVVFRVEQLLLKCTQTFEQQVRQSQEEHRKKQVEIGDQHSHVIRGQAQKIEILTQKLEGWRSSKAGQNERLNLLHAQAEQLKAQVKTGRLELERVNAKHERVVSQAAYTTNKLAEKDTQTHQLMGTIGMLKMQLNSARNQLRRTKESAGNTSALLLERAQKVEDGMAEMLAKSTKEVQEVRATAEKEYEDLVDTLSRERERRIQNEALLGADNEKLRLEASVLAQNNRDLEVDAKAMRDKIAELEHELRYGKIQRKFQMSLGRIRSKQSDGSKTSDAAVQTEMVEMPSEVLDDYGIGNQGESEEELDSEQPEEDDDDDNDAVSEESTWDDAERFANELRMRTKHEQRTFRIKQHRVGPSSMYVKALQYYRPATHTNVSAIQQMLGTHMIAAARARERKYAWGWGYFVEQYRNLVRFKTIEVEHSNQPSVTAALISAKINARMGKRQWKRMRRERSENLWELIMENCVDLTNEANSFPSASSGRKRRRRRARKSAPGGSGGSGSGGSGGSGGEDAEHVALDDVVLDKKIDPTAHYDPRFMIAAAAATAVQKPMTAALKRPMTAGTQRQQRRSLSPRSGGNILSARPLFVAPKRPSSASTFRHRARRKRPQDMMVGGRRRR